MPQPPASVEVGDARPGETRIRRAFCHPEYLTERPSDGVDTMHDVLLFCARVHGTKNALGWRDVLDVHEEVKDVKKMVGGEEVTEKKKWSYWELSDFKYLNFIQFKDAVAEAAKGLVELGIAKRDVFNIYAMTSVNWQMMAHACSQINVTFATAYDSLGESGLLHALNEPECTGIFTNSDLLPTLAKVLAKAPSVRVVIYDGDAPSAHLDSLRNARSDLKLYSLQELRNLGKDKPAIPADRLPAPSDVACIMYTSGSTGAPKGVVLLHSNLVSALGGVRDLFGNEIRKEDVFLAFLPLAHIFELIVELALTYYGVTIGYGRVKTLTDASVRKCYGDIRALQPTVLVAVPAVWETIRKGIIGKVNQSGTLRKNVFNGALSIKRAGVPVLKSVVDSAVFSQIRSQLGGRLRLALSGGAAVSRETQEFLGLALVDILQGYGLTESVAMCAINIPKYHSIGAVGVPVPGVELKLRDHPEAGYLTSNNPPQGEVLIRGPSVTKGYYKRDDLNKDPSIFAEDGWFRTGDIGQWNADGTLSLIDRIKNLVKLQGGEYVALERLESTYKSCNLVSNICVHAHADARQPIAIIFPHEVNLRQALSGTNVDSSADLAELCKKKEVRALLLKECNAAGKKNGFKTIEILQAVILTPDEWTPQNELVTAAQKLQRRKIEEKHSTEIKDVYKHAQG